jgi:hypothetical protein
MGSALVLAYYGYIFGSIIEEKQNILKSNNKNGILYGIYLLVLFYLG